MGKHKNHICRFNDGESSCECYDLGRKDEKKIIYTSGFFRQIFREMPDNKIFTAKQLGDFFERYAPFDPKGLIARHFRKELYGK